MLNVVVRDMAASLGFYRRPGTAVPGPGDAAGPHVQLKMPGGFSLELDTAGPARRWHAARRADPASATVVLGFVLAGPASHRRPLRRADLGGLPGRRLPFGSFWGARYAIVADPDGNDVGMSPVEESRRTWPPRRSPGALRPISVGRHGAGRIPR